MEIITRKEAKALGLKMYFTGKPCLRSGHIAKRAVGNKNCCECDKERCASYRAKNRDYLLECNKAYYQKHREERKISDAEYRATHKEQMREYKKKWAPKYRRRSYVKAEAKIRSSKRRAELALRLPKWADIVMIREVYKNCPSGMHVDHIYPLQGKLVSGLHVSNNLQYLPASENQSKGNRFTPVIQ